MPCLEQIRLSEDVDRVQSDIVELITRQHEALVHGHENTLMAIDRQIELKFGEKQRAIGALRQHRRDHGC